MKKNSSKSDIWLVCLVAYCLLQLTSTYPSARGRKTECFKGIRDQNFQVPISTDLGEQPLYLQMKLKLNLTSTNPETDNKVEESVIHLMKSEIPCDTPLVFSTMTMPYRQLILEILLLTGYDSGEYARFKYQFDHDFETIRKLTDEAEGIQIPVEYKEDNPFFIHRGVVLTKEEVEQEVNEIPPTNNPTLCFKTENNFIFRSRPNFISSRPSFHISHFAHYTYSEMDQKIYGVKRLVAFTCVGEDTRTEDVRFIYEGNSQVQHVFVAESPFSDRTSMDYNEFLTKPKFEIPGAFYTTTDVMAVNNRWAEDIYLAPATSVEARCPDGRDKTVYTSVSGREQYQVYRSWWHGGRGIKFLAWNPTVPQEYC